MKKLIFSLALISLPAYGEIVQLETVPSSWKLENYIGDTVVAWFTGSSCGNGKISFQNTVTESDKSRFWSVVMAAKMSDRAMFVLYDNATPDCFVSSFGMR